VLTDEKKNSVQANSILDGAAGMTEKVTLQQNYSEYQMNRHEIYRA